VGLPGVQGAQGPTGPAWLYQPTPAELVAKVREVALDVSPRTLLNPREAAAYATALTSALIKLQGGLFLRAIVTTEHAAETTPVDMSNVRSIA